MTDPSGTIVIPGATSHTIQGTAEDGSLVRIWFDPNANGAKDPGETLAGQQQAAAGATAFAISVPLQRGNNTFTVTATDAAENESAAKAVPAISSPGALNGPDLDLSLSS